MKIVVIHNDIFHQRPPVISSTMIMSELGHQVTLCTCAVNDYWRRQLHIHDIDCFVVPRRMRRLHRLSVVKKFSKAVNNCIFRMEIGRILKMVKPDLIWMEDIATWYALDYKLIHQYKYVLQIQELYENSEHALQVIGHIINDASAVIMPEYNRAVTYKEWFKLRTMPYILPNKPYFIPSADYLKRVLNSYPEYKRLFESKKVILYQGILHKERNLIPYIQAVKGLGNQYVFVLIGRDYGMVKTYKAVDPDIIHIDYLPAPDYLAFTMMAYIGVVTYDDAFLNTAYCAPNKIYEYSNFGLPMIGNDIPGLRYTIGNSGAGVLVKDLSASQIKNAIKQIESHYSVYRESSLNFYKSVDNKSTIKEVLGKIEKEKVPNACEMVLEKPDIAYVDIIGVRKLPIRISDNCKGIITYRDEKGQYFKKRVVLSVQGASTLLYPKKNLSVAFGNDLKIGDWSPQDSFLLKASWLDTFRGGLAIATSYKLYHNIARDDTAIRHQDCFPCVISVNGKFQGVYAWQNGLHRNNMNMNKDNPRHVWFLLDKYTDSLITGDVRWKDIEIWNPQKMTRESKGYIMDLAQYNNELLALEKVCSEEIMRKEIARRFDVDSVINMIIHGLVTSNIDGFGKNVNFFTFDGKKWFVMPYDLDETFGNSWIDSFQFPAYQSYLTEDYTMQKNLGKVPYCWIMKFFRGELEEKYRLLRKDGTITSSSIMEYLLDWNARVGANNYALEYEKWPNSPSSGKTELSDKWMLVEGWNGYDCMPDYDPTKEYEAGDICRYDYRLWQAMQQVKNVPPVILRGYTDTGERVRNWLNKRIELEDLYLQYKR